MYLLVNLLTNFPCCRARKASLPWKFIDARLGRVLSRLRPLVYPIYTEHKEERRQHIPLSRAGLSAFYAAALGPILK